MDSAVRIFEELQLLRSQVTQLEGRLSDRPGAQVITFPTAHTNSVRVSIDRLGEGRKPFFLNIDGYVRAREKLSPMRAAVALVLLLDLSNRMDGGSGISDIRQGISDVLKELDAEEYNKTGLENSIRVAIYRFEIFCADRSISNPDHGAFLRFVKDEWSLEFVDNRGASLEAQIRVELSSTDAALGGMIDKLLATSPLDRVRKRRVLFVPGGPAGFDRLFLELFDHSFDVEEHSLYFKPSIITYPYELLEFMGVSEPDVQRKRLMLDGFKRGRCRFFEVINRSSIRNIITVDAQGKFRFYPHSVTQRHIEMHLEHLASMVRKYQNYHLVLTDAPLPFLLSTFKIHGPKRNETFTVFFRQEIREHDPHVSCFVMCDELIFSSVLEHVFDWVLSHPSTLSSANGVEQEILATLAHLRAHGPVAVNEHQRSLSA